MTTPDLNADVIKSAIAQGTAVTDGEAIRDRLIAAELAPIAEALDAISARLARLED